MLEQQKTADTIDQGKDRPPPSPAGPSTLSAISHPISFPKPRLFIIIITVAAAFALASGFFLYFALRPKSINFREQNQAISVSSTGFILPSPVSESPAPSPSPLLQQSPLPTPSLKPTLNARAMYLANAQHTGFYEGKSAASGSVRWQAKPGQWGAASAPVVAYDTVFFGGWDKYLYALDAQTGQEKWTYALDDFVSNSPLVVDNHIYLGDRSGNFYALNIENRELVWKFKIKTEKQGRPFGTKGRVNSPATYADRLLYFSDNSGRLYALTAASGQTVWEFDKPHVYSLPAPAIFEKTVFVSTDYGLLYAIDAQTGEEKWRFQVSDTLAAPVYASGIIYVACQDGYLYAVNAGSGEQIWKYPYISGRQIIAVFPQPVAYHDGEIYLSGTHDARFEVIDAATGTLKRTFAAESWFESAPAVTTDAVYAGTFARDSDHHGYLYAIDRANFTEKWKFRVDYNGVTNPPVVHNGTVYFRGNDGTIYALE